MYYRLVSLAAGHGNDMAIAIVEGVLSLVCDVLKGNGSNLWQFCVPQMSGLPLGVS
jgi:hypothetical protein